MKLITGKSQVEAFKRIVEIIKVLATIEGDEADFAIGDVYALAGIVGNKEMMKILRGGIKIKPVTNSSMVKWSKDDMLAYIRLLEDMVDREVS